MQATGPSRCRRRCLDFRGVWRYGFLVPSFNLTPLEARILGSLVEKERVTPENYPISLHSLTAACNQTTNREPITAFDEKTVESGLDSLRQKKLATVVFGAGSRVQKYRHNLLDHFELNRRDTAVLCVLLLRGPQTPGELRSRSERMAGPITIEEVDATIAELSAGDAPLVRMLPARPGQKERRYVQLLSEETDYDEAPVLQERSPEIPKNSGRLQEMERELAEMKDDLRQLREEFASFRKQFE